MKRLYIFICLMVLGDALMAQSISASQGGGPFLQFNSTEQLAEGGISAANIQVQFDVRANENIDNWKLTVKVVNPILTNGTALDPQFISLKHNPSRSNNPNAASSIRAIAEYIPLSFDEVVLIPSAALPSHDRVRGTHFYLKYDLKIQGGQPLMDLQNGTYYAPLLFQFYDGNGNLRVSSTTVYNFGKWFSDPHAGGPNAYRTITLVNGAHDVHLNFASDYDYQNGVSVTIPNGLKVQGQAGYQVKVRSITPNFSSNQSSVIPVSAVKLQSSAGNLAPPASYSTISLSNNSQTIVRKTGWTDPNPVYYNLRYYTSPNDTNIRSAGGGSYTTILYFLLEPN